MVIAGQRVAATSASLATVDSSSFVVGRAVTLPSTSEPSWGFLVAAGGS